MITSLLATCILLSAPAATTTWGSAPIHAEKLSRAFPDMPMAHPALGPIPVGVLPENKRFKRLMTMLCDGKQVSNSHMPGGNRVRWTNGHRAASFHRRAMQHSKSHSEPVGTSD